MAYPDNFSAAVFVQIHGSIAYDRMVDRADREAAEVVALNRRIAEVLIRARAELVSVGAPEHCMSAGYDFADILAMLSDMTPALDAKAVETAHNYTRDVAMAERNSLAAD